MSISTIDKQLLNFFAQLDEEQKKSLLQLMRTFLKGKKELADKITLEQYNRELDQAMERVVKGEYTTLEDLENEMKGW